MPKKKQTPEQQKEAFDNWWAGPEGDACRNYMDERSKVKLIELATKDICEHLEKYLEALFTLIQVFKCPGRKAKCNYIDLLFIMNECRV